jgi:prepilin-type N-terminal cleavage/methylation domain-containing protein
MKIASSQKEKTIPPNIQGFTLVEILIVIVVLSILFGLCSLSFSDLSPKYRLKKAVWELHSRLNFARYKAVFHGQKVKMTLGSGHYTIESYDEEQKMWELDLKNNLEGVCIEANNSPIFHPAGTVSNMASIFVSNSWGRYKITIAITGRIKTALL